MNLIPDSQTLIQVVWCSRLEPSYPDLTVLQQPHLGLKAARLDLARSLATNNDLRRGSSEHDQPHLLIVFGETGTEMQVAEILSRFPQSRSFTLTAPEKSNGTFLAIRDLAEILNGSSLIGVDFEDILATLCPGSDSGPKTEVVITESSAKSLDEGLSASLESLCFEHAEVSGLLVLIATPEGMLMTNALRTANKKLQASFPNLKRLLYGTYVSPDLTNTVRISLWTSSIRSNS